MQPPGTSANHLVSYVESSNDDDPGHLVIGQESSANPPHYFGYRFNPVELPPEFQSPTRYREYLFTHSVPGHIVDETPYVEALLQTPSRKYWTRRHLAENTLSSILPPEPSWFQFALYSFNPDDFPDPAKRCYNCVTWGVETANRLVPNFLLPVRQGRVKLIIQQMEAQEAGAGR